MLISSVMICFLYLSLHKTVLTCNPGRTTKSTKIEYDKKVIFLSGVIHKWMKLPRPNFGNMPATLFEVFGSMSFSSEIGENESEGPLCNPCKLLSAILIYNSRELNSTEVITKFMIQICNILIFKKREICVGLISNDMISLNYIIVNTNLDSNTLCSLVLGGRFGCGPFKGPSWSLNISSTSKKEWVNESRNSPESKNSIGNILRNFFTMMKKQSVKKRLKVLHLADIHYDPNYVIGSNARCKYPLCCHNTSGRVRKPSDAAGKWGDYRSCDSPKWLLENMYEHINKNHPDIDYIICTGDLVPHNIWEITKDSNLKIINATYDMLLQYFPNTPFYGAIGNHESYPRDSFPPPESPEVFSEFGNQWLYDALIANWERFQGQNPLPSTARFGGYYSIVVRPGLRLISLNTNFCYTLNWWTLYNSVDPGNLLKWLIKELEAAESNKEFVHMFGHIPPLYEECYAQWSHQFSIIVSRFSHIIRGQFYGHTHNDEFRIHYDVNDPKTPINVEYITPTTGIFENLNPSYRLFYIDGDYPETTRNVLDYDTYILNLTYANTYDDPKWYKLYSAKEDYQLPDLSPSSWDNLVKRFSKDPSLFSQYYRYFFQDGDRALRKKCDAKCRRKHICSMIDGDLLLPSKCTKCCTTPEYS